MSIYFDVKTIKKFIGENYYRQQKQFTLEELAKYDGTNGRPIYVAVEGIVYDFSKVPAWISGTHFGLMAGKDLTMEFRSCHEKTEILGSIPKVGVITQNKDNNILYEPRLANQYTYEFSPDDWIRYITPLVNSALEAVNSGIDLEYLFQKFILAGVLVGQGRTIEEAENQVNAWEKSGIAQLLNKSKNARIR